MSARIRHPGTRDTTASIHLGFQIAPMIDVVFVIMLFFMVQAACLQSERALHLPLPGIPPVSPPVAEESWIRILDTGEILLNEDPVATGDDQRLTGFVATMRRLADASRTAKAELLVSILADEQTPYQRVIDVLNALSPAGIEPVSVGVSGD